MIPPKDFTRSQILQLLPASAGMKAKLLLNSKQSQPAEYVVVCLALVKHLAAETVEGMILRDGELKFAAGQAGFWATMAP